MPGRDIGPIDIREEITIVTVPAKFVDTILKKLSRARFRGRAVNLQLAEDHGASTPPGAAARGVPPSRAPRRDFRPDKARSENRGAARPQQSNERAPKRFDRRDAVPRSTSGKKEPFYSRVAGAGAKRSDSRGPKSRKPPR